MLSLELICRVHELHISVYPRSSELQNRKNQPLSNGCSDNVIYAQAEANPDGCCSFSPFRAFRTRADIYHRLTQQAENKDESGGAQHVGPIRKAQNLADLSGISHSLLSTLSSLSYTTVPSLLTARRKYRRSITPVSFPPGLNTTLLLDL